MFEDIKIHDVTIVDYSDKAIAIIGNTKPVKELLKSLNCKYNQSLRVGNGWIASKKKRNLIQTKLTEYFKLTEK